MTDLVLNLGNALDRLMPMHALLSPNGRVTHAGPTLEKLCPQSRLRGRHLFDVFTVRRPRVQHDMESLVLVSDSALRLEFVEPPHTVLRGSIVPLPEDGGYLLNLSFGIGIIEAVGNYGLNAADFAPTDLTIEMLYLHEAKSAVLEESRRLNARLDQARSVAESEALTDELTQLANRRAIDIAIAREIEAGRPFTLMHLDLDFFKEVNDTYGHAAGDRVLQKAADVFRAEIRSSDMAGRAGGDEFLILLRGPRDPELVRPLADRIIHQLEQPIPFGDIVCRVSVSAGAVFASDHPGADAQEITRLADVALYASKRRGRAQLTLYDPHLENEDFSVSEQEENSRSPDAAA
ncbi:MAG: diguanylate cyclase [Pseudomonadota bacterium]